MSGAEPSPSTQHPPEHETTRRLEPDAGDDAPTLAYGARPGPAAVVPAGRILGNYELLSELGRGGMGVVYKARQIELNRTVALKMLLSGVVSSPDEVQRFRVEAEAAGRLQHPNIVQIYEIGEVEGQYYYSMEYVDGPSLAQRLASGPLPGRDAARYLATIARAVHHAHVNGILHRDLKPSNILLVQARGLQPGGLDTPKIADFGLAKKVGADSSRTRAGAILGTPSYMPPEQANGRLDEVGPRSDVYSLGAILYEALTGRPPFRAETALDTLRQVIDRQPAPPRLLNAKVDRDLETICLKCLEKAPQHRYESALALAEDLERYLHGDSISASSFNVLDRIGRTLEREQYLGEFQTWGSMLLVFAGIVLVEHLVMYFLTRNGPPYPRFWMMLARFTHFGLMGLVFWRQRQHTLLPTTAAERQLYAIWVGFMGACMAVGGVHHLLLYNGRAIDDLTMYPFWTIVTGLAFFAMGSNYWGFLYILGLGYFGLAALMVLALDWAVLIYGGAWTATLAFLGLYLRRMGQETRRHGDTETRRHGDKDHTGQEAVS